MRFKDNCRKLRGVNISDACTTVPVYTPDLTDEECRELERHGYDPGECNWIYVLLSDTDKINIDESHYHWDSTEYDQEMQEEVMQGLVKESDHYLVFANNCRWDGASGYNITDDVSETIWRAYDTSICPVNVSAGGKVLHCCESSHDVPMGSSTYIIALTDGEYKRLSRPDVDFDIVEDFVEAMSSRAE